MGSKPQNDPTTSRAKTPPRRGFATRPERFELPTFGSVDRRSIQLSYGRLAAQDLIRAESILDVLYRVRACVDGPIVSESHLTSGRAASSSVRIRSSHPGRWIHGPS